MSTEHLGNYGIIFYWTDLLGKMYMLYRHSLL